MKKETIARSAKEAAEQDFSEERRVNILADLGLIIHEAADAMYAFSSGKMAWDAVKSIRDMVERILKG